VDGCVHCNHLEETAGASAVFTLPPSFLTELFTKGENLQFESRIRKDIPADIMQKLRRVPYFNQSYEPDGMTVDQFNTIPSLVSTYKEFSAATQKMVDFVKDRMDNPSN
jgi:transaldolase